MVFVFVKLFVQSNELCSRMVLNENYLLLYQYALGSVQEKKDIDKIEKMLRRAARFALNRHNKTSSVKEMTVELKVKEMMVELKEMMVELKVKEMMVELKVKEMMVELKEMMVELKVKEMMVELK